MGVTFMHKIANVLLSYSWYRPLGPWPQQVKKIIYFFSFPKKSSFYFSSRSHVNQLRYCVQMLLFWPLALALPATLQTNKTFWEHPFCLRCPKNFFSPFCSASPEIIGVKVWHRQTDKFFDTIYECMGIFSFR